ncbi:hypothetical protein GCM10009078_51950 [Cupriavidus gilardii]
MRNAFAALLAALGVTYANAQVYVAPHVDRNGNYHQGHYRSAPDGNPYNNYSTAGNVNPYTGQPGTRNPYPAPAQLDPHAFQRGAGTMPLPPRPPAGQIDPYAFQRGMRGY